MHEAQSIFAFCLLLMTGEFLTKKNVGNLPFFYLQRNLFGGAVLLVVVVVGGYASTTSIAMLKSQSLFL
jgi:hypothetical protein